MNDLAATILGGLCGGLVSATAWCIWFSWWFKRHPIEGDT